MTESISSTSPGIPVGLIFWRGAPGGGWRMINGDDVSNGRNSQSGGGGRGRIDGITRALNVVERDIVRKDIVVQRSSKPSLGMEADATTGQFPSPGSYFVP